VNKQPKILLAGKAGSGKDTVAGILVKHYGAAAVAMADPMKRFAQAAFCFTEEQLWGPSSARNAIDPRFTVEPKLSDAWEQASRYIEELGRSWLAQFLGRPTDHDFKFQMREWLFNLITASRKNGGLSPRLMLQTVGTELVRSIDDEAWIKYADRVQNKLLRGGYEYDRTKGLVEHPGAFFPLVVVTDGRFPNEILGFKDRGAVAVRVRDPEGEKASAEAQAAGVRGHASEVAQDQIPDWWFDTVLMNDKRLGMEGLEAIVDEAVSTLTNTPCLGAFKECEEIFVDWTNSFAAPVGR
jgi:hypothetical protein